LSNDRFARLFAQEEFDPHLRDATDPVLIACSGGGDSIALLHLTLHAIGTDRVHVASVNHNLREGAASEITLVARQCTELGVPHLELDWHWDGQGNLQSAARDARRKLLVEAADKIGACHILLGHTRDDQAETFLLRLARGSGVDGLAGMDAWSGRFYRPMLNLNRADLRDWLQTHRIPWAEDPSNEDPRFDRVKARAMMEHLAGLGLTQDRIIATAARMAAERQVLAQAARDFGRAHTRTEGGDVCVEAAAFDDLLPSMKTRVLAGILAWFSGDPYKPRAGELDQWFARIVLGRPAPLRGVLAHWNKSLHKIRFYREPAALGSEPVAAPAPGGSVLWDHRWTICHTGSNTARHTGSNIAPLGGGISNFENWRDRGLPRVSLETSPALWRDGTCVAAFCIDPPDGWSVRTRDWWHSIK